MRKIDPDGRECPRFLEAAGVLESSQREAVGDRIMTLDEPEVGVEQDKLIVLVLGNQGERNALLPGERPASEHPGALHR